jgi:hypothetical protein
MKVIIKPLVVTAVLLLVAETIAFGQNGSNPQRPADISGNWTMEIGKCKGPIKVDLTKSDNLTGTTWVAIYTAGCGDDNSTWSEKYFIWAGSEGIYFFSGVGTYKGKKIREGFNLHWKTDGKTLVGSSSFHLPVASGVSIQSVTMYKK